MKLQNTLILFFYLLIQISSYTDIKLDEPKTLIGRWKIEAGYSRNDLQQIIPGSNLIVYDSVAIILLKDSTFQIINNGNIFPKHTAESLGFGDTIIGLWHTRPDSLLLRIPYKSDTLLGSYKIIDFRKNKLTLKLKEFEVETYRQLRFSKY